MIFQRYLAGQICRPAGIIGEFIIGPLWNKRNQKLNEVTLDRLELKEDDRVIDIGFGGGYLLERIIPMIKSGLAAGIDASPVLIKNYRARQRKAIEAGRVDIRCGRAEALPYPDGHFAKVCSVNSLFYWSRIQKGISEIYRILGEGGKVVLTFTCKRDLEDKWFTRYGVKPLDEREVQQMLTGAGFRDIEAVRDRDRHREFVCMTGHK